MNSFAYRYGQSRSTEASLYFLVNQIHVYIISVCSTFPSLRLLRISNLSSFCAICFFLWASPSFIYSMNRLLQLKLTDYTIYYINHNRCGRIWCFHRCNQSTTYTSSFLAFKLSNSTVATCIMYIFSPVQYFSNTSQWYTIALYLANILNLFLL